MALSDPSVLQQGIERHPNECSKKLPVPLEVNIAGRNLKITDYNELFDLNKINGNSRRITTLTIRTVSTYKQKVDPASGIRSSDQPPSPPSRSAPNNSQQSANSRPFNQNKQQFEETSKLRRFAESNKEFQFNCANGAARLNRSSHNLSASSNKLSDKENNSLNQVLKSAGDSARGDLAERRKIKQISIKKSIEVEPKPARAIGASADDHQLNYKGQQADDSFLRNQRRSSSLRQINLFTKYGNAELKPNEPPDATRNGSYFVSGKFDHRDPSLPNGQMMGEPQRHPKGDQKGREFYFNGTNKLYKDEMDNLSSRLNSQKMSAAVNEQQAMNSRRFKEHLNASLNSSFNSNYNYNPASSKDGNNNSSLKRTTHAGNASLAASRQSHHQYSANSPPQISSQINQQPQQPLKQSNQFSYLEQHQQPNQQVIRKKLNRKLSAGGNAIDEINSDEFVNELKSKISSNNQTTSSPEAAARRNHFSSNSLDKERKNHLILDTSTMPHLGRRVDSTTTNIQQQTLPPTSKPSFITSTVRRNESFQKATEHPIRMEPRSRSVRSAKDKDVQQPSESARLPPSGQQTSPNTIVDKLDSQLAANNKSSQRFSFLGSQAANGYQAENYLRSSDNLANETCTTDDWNTTLDTNAETRSSADDRSRQYKKTDKYGFFVDEDPAKSGRTGSIRKEDEQSKRTNSEVDKRREKKWLEMLQKWDQYMQRRWNKICERCRKGIPPSLRGVAWFHLCAAHKQKRNKTDLFNILNQKPGNESINDEIVKDLHRQFPNHELFAGTNTEGQQDLFIILKNFSIYNQEVGYCQGLAPIVCVLLMHLPAAEDVFFVLVQLCDHYLSGYFSAGLETIQMHGKMLNSLLKRHNNTVYKILKKQKIDPTFYMTEWFMCVFARTLPWPTVLRIWDMFFCEGIKIVFRVALVILNSLEPDFKRAKCNSNDKLVETMEILKNLPRKYLEIDYLLPRVIQMDLSEKDLEAEHFSILKQIKKKKK